MIDAKGPIPVANVRTKERLSVIWLVPLVALAIGLWLLYQTMLAADTLIQVRFNNGNGLQADKTELRYKGVMIGQVEAVTLAPDSKGVIADIVIQQTASHLIREGSRFWRVKPQISLQGVSGLDTLLSGQYISLSPGDGEPQDQFVGLESAPQDTGTDQRLVIRLIADSLGSLQEGSPVHYRDVTVGRVLRYQLDTQQDNVVIFVEIDQPYRELVRVNSHFWNSSGIVLEGGIGGLKLRTKSLATILLGGLSFDIPRGKSNGAAAAADQQFTLYDDFEAASTGITIDVIFDSAEGLQAGITSVQYRGIKVGTVSDVRLRDDLQEVIAEISLPWRAQQVLNQNSRFWMVKPQLRLSGISGLETIVKGNHIELDPGVGNQIKTEYRAINEPPPFDRNLPGLHLQLLSSNLADLSRGAPVYYRRIPVGVVQGHRLTKKGDKVVIDVQIEQKYASLINTGTRFWKLAALTTSGSLTDLKLNIPPLRTLLAGGIEFDTIGALKSAKALPDDHRFTLYLDQESALRRGYKLELLFIKADGIQAGTEIRHRGLKIGEVRSIRLDTDTNRLAVVSLINTEMASQMTSESRFWIESPELGLIKSKNLGTIVTGNYINFHPGGGEQVRQVIGLEKAPNLIYDSNGMHLTLEAERLNSIAQGAPVYYRQVAVGQVRGYELGEEADKVLIHISIDPEYAPLVHQNTQFWNSSGLDFKFEWLSGAELRTESIQALLDGGISFATPEDPQQRGEPSPAGSRFTLHQKVDNKWLQWRPKIALDR
ncbi:MAG: MlaD family protein [Motiliproteus sp.]